MRSCITICILIISGQLMSQSGINPFDLSYRLDSTYTATLKENQKTSVFDIDRSRPVAIPKTTPSKTTTAVSFETYPDEDQSLPTEQINLIAADGDNPFEVSHIPLRKSKLKQEADAFTISKVKNKPGDNTTSNTFIFWLTLLSGVFIAFVINTKAHVIPRLVKSITNTNILTYNMREENAGLSGQYIMLYITYFINAAVLIYLLLLKFTALEGYMLFAYCLLVIVSVYGMKHIVLALLGYIFPIKKNISVYNFSIEVFNILLGLGLIPLNLIIAFGPTQLSEPFIYLTLGLIACLLFVRSIRALFVAAPYVQRNFFQFFIYLWAIEIVPILLLIKMAQ